MFENRKESFPEREERIQALWEKEKVFKKSVDGRKEAPLFSMYDGPPFATGLPHYGHLLAGTIKDVIPRYKTMKGYRVPRRFGWDTHGLPVEMEIEKALELSGAADIEQFARGHVIRRNTTTVFIGSFHEAHHKTSRLAVIRINA